MKTAFEPISDPQSKILILGTMPGEKSIEVQQYYGHPQNQFWKLLFTIFDQPFSTNYHERETLLRKNHIALWDVLSHCEGEGSADTSIKNEIANDFDTFYRLHPAIKHVFFASKQAEKFYLKYAGKRDEMIYQVLPSPSPANAAKSFEQKLEEWRKINFF
jgi:hypoxanthine-DNA glycosylase